MNFKLTDPTGEYDFSRYLTNLFIDLNGYLPHTMSASLRVETKQFFETINEVFGADKIKPLSIAQSFNMAKKKVNNGGIRYYQIEGTDFLFHTQGEQSKTKYFNNYIYFVFNEKHHDVVLKAMKALSKFTKVEKKTNHINIVIEENGSYHLKSFEVKKPKFNLEDNYDDVNEIHKNLIKRLNTKGDKGIALFYGEPGCGKTNYIRYLLTQIKKTVIYLPPDMASHISSPSFIPFLMNYPNSVLVIEDAENIIKKRETGGSQSIANLLNLGDGLLSDILNIQIVGTFNCNYRDIDEALLRKGRLICKHEFQKLSVEKGQKLSKKLGFKTTITEPMTLSDIYNQDDVSYKTVRKSVGFTLSKFKQITYANPLAEGAPIPEVIISSREEGLAVKAQIKEARKAQKN